MIVKSVRLQRGLTLIELMIGMIVGLIVLSAVIYAFISTLRSSKDVVNSTELNIELSTLGSLMTGEIRRAGYWVVSSAGATSPFGASPDLYLESDCILLSYYDDSDPSDTAQPKIRGFALVSGANQSSIRYLNSSSHAMTSCSDASSWPIVHSDDVRVKSLAFDCSYIDGITGVSSADCTTYEVSKVKRRRVEVNLEVEHTRDPDTKLAWSDSVYLQNDFGE